MLWFLRLVLIVQSASPVEPGPYGVGVSTWNLVDSTRGNRPLPTEVWYPTAEPQSGLEAIRDAACANGRFPLIVFSHGSKATRVQSSYLTTHLASHGYIVVAPDHTGNTALGGASYDQLRSAMDRPIDVTFVIDETLRRDGSEREALAQRLRKDRIAVMGHSFGGYTALVVGGAEVDGKAAADRFGRRVDFETYRRPDERAAVIVAYAPVGPPIFSPEGLKKVTRPLLVFGGTNDQILPFEQHQAPIFEFAGGPCYLAALQGGSHFAFNNAALTALVGFVKPKRKVEELVDRKVADELVKSVTLAFLQRHLLGDDRWASALAARPPVLTFKAKNVKASPVAAP